MIYEGTNEIQAIDLLVRKVLSDGGQALGALMDELEPGLSEAGRSRSEQLRQITQSLVQASRQDAALPYAVADDYLRAVALVLMDWGWAQITAAPGGQSPRWQQPALALHRHVLPEFGMRLAIMQERCRELQSSTPTVAA
jgi:hypothetical protein